MCLMIGYPFLTHAQNFYFELLRQFSAETLLLQLKRHFPLLWVFSAQKFEPITVRVRAKSHNPQVKFHGISSQYSPAVWCLGIY